MTSGDDTHSAGAGLGVMTYEEYLQRLFGSRQLDEIAQRYEGTDAVPLHDWVEQLDAEAWARLGSRAPVPPSWREHFVRALDELGERTAVREADRRWRERDAADWDAD